MASLQRRASRPNGGVALTSPCNVHSAFPSAWLRGKRRRLIPTAQGVGTGGSQPASQNAAYLAPQNAQPPEAYYGTGSQQAFRGTPTPVVTPREPAQPAQPPYSRPASLNQTQPYVQRMQAAQPLPQAAGPSAAYQETYQVQPSAPSSYVRQYDRTAAPQGTQDNSLQRMNPGRAYLNSVTLLGIVGPPDRQATCVRAPLSVPFSSRAGYEEFFVEAWEKIADQLEQCGSQKRTVVVEGRLARDPRFGSKVVAYRVKLVDPTLPPAAASAGPSRSAALPRVRLEPAVVWRAHYEAQSQTIQSLAAHFQCVPPTVEQALLQYAFQTQSPLRWRVLAEEAGLCLSGAGDESLTLNEFMAAVSKYKQEMDDMRAAAQPGAAAPEMPVTKEGMPKVRPIRDWALSKGDRDPYGYAVKMYEGKHGLGKLYSLLRLAVVAEATQGAWDYDAEFGPQV